MAKAEARVETVKSMVIVAEINGPEYCSGFVAITRAGQGTYIVTDISFVKGRERSLKVFFFDNTVLPASLIHRGPFCFLRTDFHPACEQIEFIKGNITPSRAILFPPSSPTSFYHLPSFVTLESAESYPQNLNSTRVDPTDQIPGLGSYFIVDCHYNEKTSGGDARLLNAPVYTMSGKVMGIVVGCDPYFTWKKIAASGKNVLSLINSLIALVSRNKNKKDGDGSSGNKKNRDGDGSSGNKKKRDRDGSFKGEFAGNKRSKVGEGSSKKLSGNKSSSKSSSEDKGNKGAGHKISSKGKLGGCDMLINSLVR